MLEDLRRLPRVAACCRVAVTDRYGVWTAVTDDVGTRGCQIVTARQLRAGTRIHVTLSSDLFPEELETFARVAWVAPDRLGVSFVKFVARAGALSPTAWVERLREAGQLPDSATTNRIAPSVQRSDDGNRTTASARNGRIIRRATSAAEPDVRVRSPVRRA